MSTEAQIAANRINAQASTGPTSAAGQARVLSNAEPVRPYPRSTEPERSTSGQALSSGLYSSGDFVRPEEQEIYAQFCIGFRTDLAPEGAIEQTLSAEIIHAAWRLRRCSAIEAAMPCDADPTELDRTQLSVDRARAQAHRIFHRTTAELRRFQTERRFRMEFMHADADADTTDLGLASFKDLGPALTKLQPKPAKPEFTKQSQPGPSQPGSPALAALLGRNSPCTCGSGLKFKRCCGKDAPPVLSNVLHHAA